MISDLIIYMLILYLFILFIYFFIDYRKYKNHHRNLYYLKDNLELLDNLPQDLYLEEKMYQEILQELQRKMLQLKKEKSTKIQ